MDKNKLVCFMCKKRVTTPITTEKTLWVVMCRSCIAKREWKKYLESNRFKKFIMKFQKENG